MAIAMIVGITSVVVPLAAQRAAAATLNVSYTREGCNLDHGGTINTVTHMGVRASVS